MSIVVRAIDALAEFGPFETFKVAARRSNTDYELTSMDLNRQVGEALCLAYPEKKVQMREPDACVTCSSSRAASYVYASSMRMAWAACRRAAPAKS
ncbi:MAG: THUMP domain-containing protein [Collinsella sp.]